MNIFNEVIKIKQKHSRWFSFLVDALDDGRLNTINSYLHFSFYTFYKIIIVHWDVSIERIIFTFDTSVSFEYRNPWQLLQITMNYCSFRNSLWKRAWFFSGRKNMQLSHVVAVNWHFHFVTNVQGYYGQKVLHVDSIIINATSGSITENHFLRFRLSVKRHISIETEFSDKNRERTTYVLLIN